MAQHPAKAMKAYEKAHAWRELFTLANEQKLDKEAIAAMVERVTGELHPRCKRRSRKLIYEIICPVEGKT
jgi:elongator complex protein 1